MGRSLTPGLVELLQRPAVEAAPHLLGALVTLDGVGVELTEVEAYGGADDPGSHAFWGRTARNAAMFGLPGTAYVFFTYGMHWCLNVVCGPAGEPSAVLLRAGRVVSGLEQARRRRQGPAGRPVADRDLARGPAVLARSLGVDGRCDGHDLLSDAGLSLVAGRAVDPGLIATGPRVGLSAGADVPWRFWVTGEASVSRYRPGALG